MEQRPGWNHNLHYHPVVLEALGTGCSAVLDVGCGEGSLARELSQTAAHVVGIDSDAPSIDLARRRTVVPHVEYVLGDILSHPFEPESFDAVVSVATLHHIDATAGLVRMRELLRPGGTLAIIGLARARVPADIPYVLAATVAHRAHRLTKGLATEPSLVTAWPPPQTYSGMRRIARRLLPGARYHRHLLWRYSVIWTKPGP